MSKPRVIYFQRKPHAGFSYSIEAVFEQVRQSLAGKIEVEVRACSLHNSGWFAKLWNVLEAFIRQGRGIKHLTGEVHFLNLLWPKKQVVLTIHDCGMVHRHQGLSRKLIQWLYLKAPLKKSAVVTTVSSASREEILYFSGFSHPDIRIIPPPLDPIYQYSPKSFQADSPQILQIGLGPNKNFERMAEALAGISCRLHIIGRLKPNHLALLKKFNLDYTNGYDLSQVEMLQAYQACDMLAFVSTFEGFGMPIMEAQAVGRPVLTSNCSSMPEVAGDGACLVNPFEVEDIRRGVLKIMEHAAYREELVAKGRENVQRFDAERIAAQYMEIYEFLNTSLD